jgi:ribonuclease E
MLIDASHPEETRVAIVHGTHLEDFDVEVESRKQLKGNIYLAKVTRVEPSLQAAFVDYGGNRHGFLAFNEIHPDYYQIPVADREALIAEQQVAPPEQETAEPREETAQAESPTVETVGGDIFEEVASRRPVTPRRRYKIQEVIKRRQILLVQVVKEERGTKGAALTTYLSLAGRYCVLMPNTARGGGISRKISSGTDRKRLKSVLSDFGIPDGMAVIVRTAGQTRSKAEIKRDYEYLMRLWDEVREKTLESMAPCLVHEEGDLIKRSIRDLYAKDIQEIVIDGDDGYRAAKDFMRMLIPSHTKRVQPFKEVDNQLFQYYGIESQLGSMHSPEVQLKSGGYIVLNPTEALVAIDVNSGRATRGRNIEETALKTNLEAADEIALQLKLRDLAGLIVIDFIDMEEHRNQVKVERRLKDAMRSDRARIQIGRISPFGLLELSRQRLRPSLIETSSEPCPYCEGTGIRRSKDSAALQLLRMIEDEGMKHRSRHITVYIPTQVALYLINHKRGALAAIEDKYKLSVKLENDDTLIPPDFRMERIGEDGRPIHVDPNARAPHGREAPGEEGGKRRRRRRGRRRPDEDGMDAANDAGDAMPADESEPPTDDGPPEEDTEGAPAIAVTTGDGEAPRGKRRRRGRRGGRRRGRRPGDGQPGNGSFQSTSNGTAGTGADFAPGVIMLGGPDTVVSLPSPVTLQGDIITLGDGSQPQPQQPQQPRRRGRRRHGRGGPKGAAPATAPSTHVSISSSGPTPAMHKPSAPEIRPPVAPAPVSPSAQAGPPPAPTPAPAPRPPVMVRPEAPAVNPDTAKTKVVNVGGGEQAEQPDKASTRKGWWSRVSQ